MSRYQRPYDHPRWRKLRLEILARDGHWCQIRGPRCTGTATQCDHIISWRELPEEQWFAPEMLRASCRPCNSQAGARRQAQLADLGRKSLGDSGSNRRDWFGGDGSNLRAW